MRIGGWPWLLTLGYRQTGRRTFRFDLPLLVYRICLRVGSSVLFDKGQASGKLVGLRSGQHPVMEAPEITADGRSVHAQRVRHLCLTTTAKTCLAQQFSHLRESAICQELPDGVVPAAAAELVGRPRPSSVRLLHAYCPSLFHPYPSQQ